MLRRFVRRQHTTPADHFRIRSQGSATPDWDALQALLEYVYRLGEERGRLTRLTSTEGAQVAMPPEPPRPPSSAERLIRFANRVASRAQNITNASGAIVALEGTSGDIVCVGRSGKAPELGARLDAKSGVSGKCVRSGASQICRDAELDASVNADVCRELGIRSMAMVPLHRDGLVFGLLSVFSEQPAQFDQHALGALKYLEKVVVDELEHRSDDARRQRTLTAPAAAPAATAPESEPPPQPAIPKSQTPVPGMVEPETVAPAPQPLPAFAQPKPSPPVRSWLYLVLVLAALGLAISSAWRSGIFRSSATTTAVPQGTVSATPSSESPVEVQVGGNETPADGITRLRSIEHWSGPGATRVTMLLDAPVKYEAYRLQGPERIYFDLHGIRLAPGLVNNPTLAGEGTLLSRIRVSQFAEDTARVVLDLKGAYRYSALFLANPPRLLVEIFDKVQPPAQPPRPSGAPVPAAKDQAAGALSGFRIVIDPGHGGNDLGTVSRRGLEEKQVALDIARRLSTLLQKNGAEVTLTRTDDRYIPLEARTQTANQAHADLFVSIHGNSSEDRAAAGSETYFFSGATAGGRSTPGGGLTEAAALDREDRQFAGDVQKALYGELARTGPLRNRGVRAAPLVVLRGAVMPAILVEISFLSSPAEEKKLHAPEYRQQIAAALCRGMMRHAARMQRAPQVVAKSGK